jgi:predicted XRE-type DNA-binding protein
MKFPKNNDIKKILKELENVEPTLVIDLAKASKSDVLKYKLCQEFVKIIKQENISQSELAKRLDVDKSIVNKIILHKIEHFTIDRLVDLLSTIKSFDLLFRAS